jgi:hypothetical protein
MSDFTDKLKELLDLDDPEAKEEVEIELIKPQFERADGVNALDVSAWDIDDFRRLRHADDERLLAVGMRPWGADKDLWLFPHEWFDDIPEGLEVTTISDETKEFHPDEFNRDIRMGVLSFGLEVEW